MGKVFEGTLEQLDPFRYRLAKSSRNDMRVDGIIYSSTALISEVLSGGAIDQVARRDASGYCRRVPCYA